MKKTLKLLHTLGGDLDPAELTGDAAQRMGRAVGDSHGGRGQCRARGAAPEPQGPTQRDCGG